MPGLKMEPGSFVIHVSVLGIPDTLPAIALRQALSVLWVSTALDQPGGLASIPIMNMEQLRELLLSFPGVTEEEPFGPEVVVYKVMGKMFALVDYDSVPPTMNLKCDPERALDLRDVHEAIRPGWHMNKRHWNTLDLDGSLRGALVMELVRHSYDLVVAALPRRVREKLA